MPTETQSEKCAVVAEQDTSSAAARLEHQQQEREGGLGEPATSMAEQLEIAKEKLHKPKAKLQSCCYRWKGTPRPKKQAEGWKGTVERRKPLERMPSCSTAPVPKTRGGTPEVGCS